VIMPENGEDKDKEQEQNADQGSGEKTTGALRGIVLVVAIALAAGAGGFLSAGLSGPKAASDQAGEVTQADLDLAPEAEEEASEEEAMYYELDVPAVNPREERLTRFVKMKLSLKIKKTRYADVEARIKEKQPEILNWLVVNLSDHSLEELTGAANINGLRRQIHDAVNELIDGEKEGLIEDVLIQEFMVE